MVKVLLYKGVESDIDRYAGSSPASSTNLTLYDKLKPRVAGSFPARRTILRDVAQPGRAPRLGRGCRMFESCHPDHGGLAQLVERLYYK